VCIAPSLCETPGETCFRAADIACQSLFKLSTVDRSVLKGRALALVLAKLDLDITKRQLVLFRDPILMRTFKGEIRYLFDSSFVAFLAGNLSTVVTSAGKAAETTNIPRDFGVGGTGQGGDNRKDGKLHC
jgi:hypothetical protein